MFVRPCQILLAVLDNTSARGNMAPAGKAFTTSGHRRLQPRAFHNQRPRAIAATGFLQPRGCKFLTQALHAATCHVHGSNRSPVGETAVDRFLGTGVGLKASAKKDEVSFRRQVAEQFCFALQFADIRRRLTEDD